MRPDPVGGNLDPSEPIFAVELDSSPLSVREVLTRLRARLGRLCLGCEAAGAVELVLAEVLNNICEHAYAGTSGGRIALSIWIEPDMLSFRVVDHGVAMPCGRLPSGRPVAAACSLNELPEGGFGWNLIRHLTADLTYWRTDGRNHLTFRMQLDASPKGAC